MATLRHLRLLTILRPHSEVVVPDNWELGEAGAHFFGMGLPHLNDPRDPLFRILRETVPRVVGLHWERPWVGLHEDVEPNVRDEVTALREEREAGWFVWCMKNMGHTVASWDLSPKTIATRFLDKGKSNELPAPFRRVWEAKESEYTLGEVLAYHFFELIKHTQILKFKMRQEEGLEIGDPPDFAYKCLAEMYGVIQFLMIIT